MTPTVEFLGVQFDNLEMQDVEGWIADRDDTSAFAYVVTPNVDHVVRLNAELEQLSSLYTNATLRLCDSVILQRLAGLCGVSLKVVRGSDLVEAVFARVVKSGDRVLVVGGSEKDIVRLRRLHPRIFIDHYIPPMGLRVNDVERDKVIDAAINASARLILLAVGSPQQEIIAFEMTQRRELHGTALCIGASVEFLTGTQKRAPLAWRRSGMEWAWRLFSDPRRLSRRYLIDNPAIFGMAWRWRESHKEVKPAKWP